ncbi:MAG: ABC transporter permease subunit [Bacillota bacterium]|nr:ABC transporter permease subunit [Bacillota bacterium]
MKEKVEKAAKFDAFTLISITIALFVMLFIGCVVCAIIIGGIPNFTMAFQSEEVRFAVKLSSVTATASTVICMLLAIPTSYALTRTNMPFKRLAGVMLELTLSMPYLLLGFSLLIIFSADFGKILKQMGIRVVFSQLGIIMAQLTVNLPFCIRMVRTAFSDVEERLEYIAQLLGASKFRAFITITLPLCKSALVSTFILTWSRALGEFGATLMLVGITRMKTETLPGCIYLNISTGNNSMAMATAMIILLISGVALIISNLLSGNKNQGRIGGS